jgi:hypothetical protein
LAHPSAGIQDAAVFHGVLKIGFPASGTEAADLPVEHPILAFALETSSIPGRWGYWYEIHNLAENLLKECPVWPQNSMRSRLLIKLHNSSANALLRRHVSDPGKEVQRCLVTPNPLPGSKLLRKTLQLNY